MVEYLNQLREGLLEGITGILQGLRQPNGQISPVVREVSQYVENLLVFLGKISSACQPGSDYVTEAVAKNAVGVLFDIAQVMPEIKQKLQPHKATFQPLLDFCRASSNQSVVELGNFALKVCF